MGDLNVNQLKKELQQTGNLFQEHDLKAIQIPYTRITSTTVSSLDVCVTNLHPKNCIVKLTKTYISDHMGVSCTLQEYKSD